MLMRNVLFILAALSLVGPGSSASAKYAGSNVITPGATTIAPAPPRNVGAASVPVVADTQIAQTTVVSPTTEVGQVRILYTTVGAAFSTLGVTFTGAHVDRFIRIKPVLTVAGASLLAMTRRRQHS